MLLSMGNLEKSEALMHQIYRDHKDEHHTMEMLMNLVQTLQQQAEAIKGMNPPTAAPVEQPAPAEKSGLWTPDQPNSPAGNSEPEKKSSIWLPD